MEDPGTESLDAINEDESAKVEVPEITADVSESKNTGVVSGDEAPADEIDEGETFADIGPDQTINVDRGDIYAGASPDEDSYIGLDLPTHSVGVLNVTNELNADTEITQSAEDLATWSARLSAGEQHYTANDLLQAAFERPGSNWGTRVPVGNGKQMGPLVTGSNNIKDGQEITEAEIARYVDDQAGKGTVVFPLPRTGIWLTITAPDDERLFDIQQIIAEDKVEAGRITAGLAYSNSAVYLEETVLDLAMECVTGSSLKDHDRSTVRGLIRRQEVHVIFAYLAAAVYANGYPIRQACTASPGKCSNVIRDTINLRRGVWTDGSMLTEAQRKFMTGNNKTKRSLKEVLDHQQSFNTVPGGEEDAVPVLKSDVEENWIQLTDTIDMYLEEPSAVLTISEGIDWAKEINTKMINALEVDNRQTRSNYLAKASRASYLLRYSHYVHTLRVKGKSKSADEEPKYGYIRERGAIVAALARISGNPSVLPRYFKACGEFVRDTSITVTGILNAHCTKCNNTVMDKENAIKDHLIALDYLTLFFTLIGCKVLDIQRRESTY